MKHLTLILASVACFGSVARSAEPIDPADFAKLHTLIKPCEDENAWEQLPWMTDLWEARKRAAAEGKPVLLWERDGHPLGWRSHLAPTD